jgi:RNA polymerase sigma factor (sigma-70 family)
LALGDEAFASVLDAAKSGAEWAWSSLYREYWRPLVGYLRSRGAAEPEDTASEVLLKIARSVHTFDGSESSFRSWVFVIAHRSLIDDHRRSSRRPETTEWRTDIGDSGGDVEEEAMEHLATGELLEALQSLTETQRDVLALRLVAGLTVDQVAEVVGKRPGAVKALQRRALVSLQKVIEVSGVTL